MIDAARAVAHLKQADPVLARAIEAVGPFRLKRDRDRFATLTESILHQQLALKAARTIAARFRQIYGDSRGRFPTPAELAGTPPRRLRAAGLSRQKIRYLKDLARKCAGGAVRLDRLGRMSDEEVIAALTRVKGIGRWTAEMFLIFSLGRPDVWAVDDLGLQLAVKKLYRLRRHPSREKMSSLGEAWRPYRTVASWYLWRARRLTLGVPLR
jgi:DNA-3-methyladenine glycosylase II